MTASGRARSGRPRRARGRAARRGWRLVVLPLLLAACEAEPPPALPFDPTPAESELPEVVAALRDGRPEEALAALDRRAAAAELPEGAGHYRALALADAGRDEEAHRAWLDELRRHPGNGRAHGFLGEWLIDHGRLDEADAHVRRALELVPDWAYPSLLAGRLALLRGEDEIAGRRFRDFLVQDPWGPQSSEAHHALAQVTSGRDDTQAELHRRASDYLEQLHKALAHARAALAADPAEVTERFRVGAAWLNLYLQASQSPMFGQVEPRRLRDVLAASEEAFAAVLAVDADNARAMFNLGNIRRIQHRRPEAEEWYRRALQADPAHTDARLNLARLLREMNDAEGTRVELLRLFEITDDRNVLGPAHLLLAELDQEQGDLHAALDHLDAILRLFPDDPADVDGWAADLRRRLSAPPEPGGQR